MSACLPKFSIIVPIYNVEKYLADCLNSICEQDYPNFELIAINDGSTDHSRSILQSFADKDRRIKILESKNKGVSAARNLGLSVSTGDYVWMVDSDDLLTSNALAILSKVIEKHTPDVITFKYNKLYKTKGNPAEDSVPLNTKKIRKLDFFRSVFNTSNSNVQYMGGYVWLRVFKRECINKISFNEQMSYYEDEDFLVRLYNTFSDETNLIFSLENRLYSYRKRLSSLINSNRQKRLLDLYRFQRRAMHYFPQVSTEFRLINLNRFVTLVKLQQLFLTLNRTSTYKKFRKILFKHYNELPLKLILPYLFGQTLATKYSIQRNIRNNVNKSKDLFWD